MRIREIAGIVHKSEDTVLRAVRRYFPSLATAAGVPVDLDDFQAYVIAKAFESPHHVQPPQSAGDPPHPAELPSGAQLRELRAAVERQIISREQYQALLGLQPSLDEAFTTPSAPGSPSSGAPEGLSPRSSQAYAIGSRILAGRDRRRQVPAGQGLLPIPGMN